MENQETIKAKRNKAATIAYKVAQPIYYIKDNELTCIPEGKVFLGRNVWTVGTGLFPCQLDKYVKQGLIIKLKAKDYLNQLNNI